MSPPNCHLSKIDVGTKTNMKILSDIKGQVLAIALLLLIVAHGSDARADEAGSQEQVIFGYTYERLAATAIVSVAMVALGYGVYVLAFGGDALLGLSAGAIGTIIAIEVGVHTVEAGVLGGSYYFWPTEQVEDPH